MILILFLLLILNFSISWWNAVVTGKTWLEAQLSGGYMKFMSWMGAIMSAAGFTWCYLLVLGMIAGALGWLEAGALEAFLYLGYLIIIPFILFAGYGITFDSWARTYRQRTLVNVGVSSYNTFASAYNTYNAIRSVPEAFGKVFDFFLGGKGRKSKDQAQALLVILLLVVALGGGIMTTWGIVNRYKAADEPLPIRTY